MPSFAGSVPTESGFTTVRVDDEHPPDYDDHEAYIQHQHTSTADGIMPVGQDARPQTTVPLCDANFFETANDESLNNSPAHDDNTSAPCTPPPPQGGYQDDELHSRSPPPPAKRYRHYVIATPPATIVAPIHSASSTKKKSSSRKERKQQRAVAQQSFLSDFQPSEATAASTTSFHPSSLQQQASTANFTTGDNIFAATFQSSASLKSSPGENTKEEDIPQPHHYNTTPLTSNTFPPPPSQRKAKSPLNAPILFPSRHSTSFDSRVHPFLTNTDTLAFSSSASYDQDGFYNSTTPSQPRPSFAVATPRLDDEDDDEVSPSPYTLSDSSSLDLLPPSLQSLAATKASDVPLLDFSSIPPPRHEGKDVKGLPEVGDGERKMVQALASARLVEYQAATRYRHSSYPPPHSSVNTASQNRRRHTSSIENTTHHERKSKGHKGGEISRSKKNEAVDVTTTLDAFFRSPILPLETSSFASGPQGSVRSFEEGCHDDVQSIRFSPTARTSPTMKKDSLYPPSPLGVSGNDYRRRSHDDRGTSPLLDDSSLKQAPNVIIKRRHQHQDAYQPREDSHDGHLYVDRKQLETTAIRTSSSVKRGLKDAAATTQHHLQHATHHESIFARALRRVMTTTMDSSSSFVKTIASVFPHWPVLFYDENDDSSSDSDDNDWRYSVASRPPPPQELHHPSQFDTSGSTHSIPLATRNTYAEHVGGKGVFSEQEEEDDVSHMKSVTTTTTTKKKKKKRSASSTAPSTSSHPNITEEGGPPLINEEAADFGFWFGSDDLCGCLPGNRHASKETIAAAPHVDMMDV